MLQKQQKSIVEVVEDFPNSRDNGGRTLAPKKIIPSCSKFQFQCILNENGCKKIGKYISSSKNLNKN